MADSRILLVTHSSCLGKTFHKTAVPWITPILKCTDIITFTVRYRQVFFIYTISVSSGALTQLSSPSVHLFMFRLTGSWVNSDFAKMAMARAWQGVLFNLCFYDMTGWLPTTLTQVQWPDCFLLLFESEHKPLTTLVAIQFFQLLDTKCLKYIMKSFFCGCIWKENCCMFDSHRAVETQGMNVQSD